MDTKDRFDIAFKMVGIVGGLIAAFRAIYEMRENRKQKEKDLRWKQSNTARDMVNQMLASSLANNATIMFDWEGKVFDVALEKKEPILYDDVRNALRITNLYFLPKEAFIRDCVDAFLFHVEFMEQAIRNELIEFKDIEFPMAYYVKVLKKYNIMNHVKVFAVEYGYSSSSAFFQRFGS